MAPINQTLEILSIKELQIFLKGKVNLNIFKKINNEGGVVKVIVAPVGSERPLIL